MSIDLKLPDRLLHTSFVFARGAPPDDATLREAIRAWIARRVAGSLRDTLLARVGDARFWVVPSRQILALASWDPSGMNRIGVEECALLALADHALMVMVGGSLATFDEDLALHNAAARALATALGGVQLDPIGGEFLELDDRHGPPPAVVPARDLVRVLCEPSEGGLRATTLGMSRFDAPDLELWDVPVFLRPHVAPALKDAAAALIGEIRAAGPGRLRLETITVSGVAFGLRPGTPGFVRLHPPGLPACDVGPLLGELASGSGARAR